MSQGAVISRSSHFGCVFFWVVLLVPQLTVSSSRLAILICYNQGRTIYSTFSTSFKFAWTVTPPLSWAGAGWNSITYAVPEEHRYSNLYSHRA